MSMIVVDLNGRPQAWPPLDRAWQFGDGVFRTVCIRDGHVRDLVGQVAHLLHDAHLLKLDPLPEVEALCHASTALAAGHARGRLKWIISGGDSAGGYARSGPPRTMLALSSLPDDYRSPDTFAAWRCETPLRPGCGWAGAKHLNRLDNVMARTERDPKTWPEGIMCDGAGCPASGISSNLFGLRHDGQLVTHPLAQGGVHGRTRARILALAEQQGQAVQLAALSWAQWNDEVTAAFVCNSLWGCVPLRAIDEWTGAECPQAVEFNVALDLGFS